LSFAYGYIMNNICSIDDDLASSRAGAKKARPAERKWVALVLLSLTRRLSRKEAEKRLVDYLCEQIQNGSELQSVAKRILNKKRNGLSATYKQARFYHSKMELAAAAEVDIPPLPEL